MTTWVVGDIHGCAAELAELVDRLALGAGDRLVCVGDLFHRGPDPAGVMDVLSSVGATFVLGNHELAVLRRVGLAPADARPRSRPRPRLEFPPLEASDLRGDGGRSCAVDAHRREDLLRFLQRHAGFFATSDDLPGARPTPDGRAWWVVHAGVEQGVPLERNPIAVLTRARRLGGRGTPYWYERYRGPELVLFGHTPSRIPRGHHADGRLVSLGLDTGCVYGGSLTAYAPELDELVSVAASRSYARP